MKYAKHILSITILFMLVVFTNNLFSYKSYYNDNLQNKVKGAKTSSQILPYPKNSNEKSATKTNDFNQSIIKVKQNYNDIYNFYFDIFGQKNAIQTYYQENDNFIVFEYTLNNQYYKVSISKVPEDNGTTVILEQKIN